jgi:hypothetical protein
MSDHFTHRTLYPRGKCYTGTPGSNHWSSIPCPSHYTGWATEYFKLQFPGKETRGIIIFWTELQHEYLTLHLISSRMPIYLLLIFQERSFSTFSNDLSAVFIPWFHPASWLRDIRVYLDFLHSTSRPTTLLPLRRVLMFYGKFSPNKLSLSVAADVSHTVPACPPHDCLTLT